jgi:hypothetical protein
MTENYEELPTPSEEEVEEDMDALEREFRRIMETYGNNLKQAWVDYDQSN